MTLEISHAILFPTVFGELSESLVHSPGNSLLAKNLRIFTYMPSERIKTRQHENKFLLEKL
jgi:hypothetical protein